MEHNINECFAGEISLLGGIYFCVVNKHNVKLFSKETPHCFPREQCGLIRKQWLYGHDESNYELAFSLPHDLNDVIPFSPITFNTPIIVKSTANLQHYDIRTFDAISFESSVINMVYNPRLAIAKNENSITTQCNGIKFKPLSDVSKSYPVLICDQSANIDISIDINLKTNNLMVDDLGSLSSLILLRFDKPQKLEALHSFYIVIKRFLSFLVMQHNIELNLCLHKIIDGKMQKIAICKLYDGHENYCDKSCFNVININDIGDKVPELLARFEDAKTPFLDFLPDNNKTRNYINHTNIQNICTCIEVEYARLIKNRNSQPSVDKLIAALNQTVKNVRATDENPSSAMYDNAFAAIRYIGLPLKQKIMYLYERYEHYIEEVFRRRNKENISIFSEGLVSKIISMRNDITHGGIICWNGCEVIYNYLECIAYFSILESAGLDFDSSLIAVKKLF